MDGDILSAELGIMLGWKPTARLRFHDNHGAKELQQLWVHRNNGAERWQDVAVEVASAISMPPKADPSTSPVPPNDRRPLNRDWYDAKATKLADIVIAVSERNAGMMTIAGCVRLAEKAMAASLRLAGDDDIVRGRDYDRSRKPDSDIDSRYGEAARKQAVEGYAAGITASMGRYAGLDRSDSPKKSESSGVVGGKAERQYDWADSAAARILYDTKGGTRDAIAAELRFAEGRGRIKQSEDVGAAERAAEKVATAVERHRCAQLARLYEESTGDKVITALAKDIERGAKVGGAHV